MAKNQILKEERHLKNILNYEHKRETLDFESGNKINEKFYKMMGEEVPPKIYILQKNH